MSEGDLAVARINFVRQQTLEPQPPPSSMTGPVGWLRENLFSTPFNIVLTILIALLFLWIVPDMLRYLIFDAVWSGADRTVCLITPERPVVGACWPFVFERLPYFIYGSYPIPERWRVDVFFVMLAVAIVWLLWLNAPRRDLGVIYAFVVTPVCSYILLSGWSLIGLPKVDTVLWGGVLVTIVVSAVGIVISLPLGILLALGRRSAMPAVKLFSVIFIEFVRGVPLVTVLFMASVMLPLFVPEHLSPDKLLRALIGIAMFASAYMAEVVRAGLAAIPKGQFEGAQAVGLGYWQMMRLIVLPQALKITIPNIVNTYIGLFKDTTLVFIVGIFDLLRTIEVSRIDPKWAAPSTSATGYAVAAFFYLICCYGMSRYAQETEKRLRKADRR
ncbi:amino acid ABC transporter permease [Undibacter mobilis]|uniref:Amino acid ABC transporter permease n=2 Tax=Undibacter mobilis TaxID=2292256 RepID=A0A371B1D1_9BRAD|nr:amino acid ABC transporter permease [Undibacter mobilis]RDV01399.1 amino acid ABC transporter permease [Undibacter mobilis]